MRQSKFTETQIVLILKEADAGRPVNEIWRGKKRGQVLQSNIPRRVAGSWFIWFPWSISLVWFDERERQARPALRIND